MSINAVPKRHSSREIPLSYTCPVDEVTTTSDSNTRWVECPLVANEYICYGSCLDLQDLARSEDFYTDQFISIFERLASKRKVTIRCLRIECLKHQKILLTNMLLNPNEPKSNVKSTLDRVTGHLQDEDF